MDIATPRPRSDSLSHQGRHTRGHSDVSSIQLVEYIDIAPDEETQATTEHVYNVSWEPEIASRIKQEMKSNPAKRPFMVALVGTPGSGEYTSLSLAFHIKDLTCVFSVVCI
jgi:hypothetical protein